MWVAPASATGLKLHRAEGWERVRGHGFGSNNRFRGQGLLEEPPLIPLACLFVPFSRDAFQRRSAAPVAAWPCSKQEVVLCVSETGLLADLYSHEIAIYSARSQCFLRTSRLSVITTGFDAG